MLIVQRRMFILFLYDWTDSSTCQAQSYLLPYFVFRQGDFLDLVKQTSAKLPVCKLQVIIQLTLLSDRR